MSPERRLIVNADDFGYDSAVNAAVVDAYRRGILRYASLMVKRPGAAEAALLARENPGLGVGLHLELCADSPAYWGLRYFFGSRDRARLEGEIEAQFEALERLGVRPTHADAHFNIHVHPVIFPLLARAAKRHGVPRLRLPGGELAAAAGYGRLLELPGIAAQAAVFGALGRSLRPKAEGLEVTRSFGVLRSGLMTEAYLLSLVRRLPPGTTEVYLHPSSDPATRVVRRPTATHHTYSELEALVSPAVRRALREEGVSLEAPAPAGGGAGRKAPAP